MKSSKVKETLTKANRVITILNSMKNLTKELEGLFDNSESISECDQAINDLHHILFLEESITDNEHLRVSKQLETILVERQDLKAVRRIKDDIRGIKPLITSKDFEKMEREAYASLNERSNIYRLRTIKGTETLADIYSERNQTIHSKYQLNDHLRKHLKEDYVMDEQEVVEVAKEEELEEVLEFDYAKFEQEYDTDEVFQEDNEFIEKFISEQAEILDKADDFSINNLVTDNEILDKLTEMAKGNTEDKANKVKKEDIERVKNLLAKLNNETVNKNVVKSKKVVKEVSKDVKPITVNSPLNTKTDNKNSISDMLKSGMIPVIKKA